MAFNFLDNLELADKCEIILYAITDMCEWVVSFIVVSWAIAIVVLIISFGLRYYDVITENAMTNVMLGSSIASIVMFVSLIFMGLANYLHTKLQYMTYEQRMEQQRLNDEMAANTEAVDWIENGF